MNDVEIGIIIRAYNEAKGAIESAMYDVGHLGDKAAGVGAATTGQIAAVGAAAAGFGAGLLAPIYTAIEAHSTFEGELAHVHTALLTDADALRELNDVQARSITLSNQSTISAVNEAEAYYQARTANLTHAEAIEVQRVSTELAVGTTTDAAQANAVAAATARELATVYHVLGDAAADPAKEIGHLGDQLALLQTKYAFRDITEINYALAASAQNFKALGLNATDVLTVIGTISAGGYHGAEAGYAAKGLIDAFASNEKLRPFKRLTAEGGLDLQGSILQLAGKYGNLPAVYQAQELSRLGFGAGDLGPLEALLKGFKDYEAIHADLVGTVGASHAAFSTRIAAEDSQQVEVLNQLKNAWIEFGSAAAPIAIVALHLASDFALWTQGIIHAHPEITKFVAEALSVAGAFFTLTGSALTLYAGWTLWKTAFTATRIGAGIAGWVAPIGEAISGIVTAITGLITWPVVIAAAFATAAAEIYTHWGAVKTFFGDLWKAIVGMEWKQAGALIIHGIASGIRTTVSDIVGAASYAAGKVAGYFVGQSPPPLGPLHDLNRVPLGDTIAKGLTTRQIVQQSRQLAAFIHLNSAGELDFARSSAAFAGAASYFALSGGTTRRGAQQLAHNRSITLNFQPHIEINVTGGTADIVETLERELMKMLRRSRSELFDLLAREADHRDRTIF